MLYALASQLVGKATDHNVRLEMLEVRNAIGKDTLRGLQNTFKAVSEDSSANVLLTSSKVPKMFCAGADLKRGVGRMMKVLAFGCSLSGTDGPLNTKCICGTIVERRPEQEGKDGKLGLEGLLEIRILSWDIQNQKRKKNELKSAISLKISTKQVNPINSLHIEGSANITKLQTTT